MRFRVSCSEIPTAEKVRIFFTPSVICYGEHKNCFYQLKHKNLTLSQWLNLN